MKKAYFITGTDTGAGKTYSTCALLHALAARGLSTVAMKPVAAGCEWRDGRLVSDDVERLTACATVKAPAELVNPYAFAPPVAPHVAAAQAGVEISLGLIAERFHALAQLADVTLVEGVGGFRVPLNAHRDSADLAVALGLPVILVVGMKLGCLNHALLSTDAIQARGLRLAGWIACQPRPAMRALSENIAFLREQITAPLLGTLRYTRRNTPGVSQKILFVDPLC